MYGDIIKVHDNVLMVEGKLPMSMLFKPDIANILLYKEGGTLYVFDTGTTAFFRKKILEAVERLSPFEKLVLLNSHSHPDHTANNSIINEIEAKEKKHYICKDGIPLMDYHNTFLDGFKKMNEYFYFLDAPPPPYLYFLKIYKLLGHINENIPYAFFNQSLEKFSPLEPSPETAIAFEDIPAKRMPVKSAEWTGWNLDGDVYALESRGHAPDHVLFYLPKIKLLFTADETFQIFPLWPDSSRSRTIASIKKIIAMIDGNEVDILLDAHHHEVLEGDNIMKMLNELLDFNRIFIEELLKILAENPQGLTVHQVYNKIKKKRNMPAIDYHFRLEFPKMPLFIKNVIAMMLLDAGCETVGDFGKKRFVYSG